MRFHERLLPVWCFLWIAIESATVHAHDSDNLGNSSHKSGKPKLKLSHSSLRLESYNGWSQWKQKYPNCNPAKNPFQSPIHIDNKQVIRDSKLASLRIHTGPAIEDCFFFSAIQKRNNWEMEAVSIVIPPICKRQVTFISGVGSEPNEHQYFKSALLFFTRSKVPSQQSLHRIDDKEFQMEIAMEFASNNHKHTTTVHLMIEAEDPEKTPNNAVFLSLEATIPRFQKEIVRQAVGKDSRKAKYQALKKACIAAEKEYSEQFDNQMQKSKDGKTNKERLKELLKLAANLNGITDEKLQNITQGTVKSHSASDKLPELPDRASELNTLSDKQNELAEKMHREADLKAIDPNFNEYQAEIDKIEKEIQIIEANLSESAKAIRTQMTNASEVEMRTTRLKQHISSLKVGIPGGEKVPGMLYESPNAVYKEIEELKKNITEARMLENPYRKACKKFEYFAQIRYGHVMVKQPFQLSWLFPSYGGYFLYNGSNPIPPCEPRETTIVFEKPIKITTEQLQAFHSIPSLTTLANANPGVSIDPTATNLDDNVKVDKMLPVIHEDEKRQVWFVNRELIFVGDDQFHQETEHDDSDAHLIGEVSGQQQTTPCKLILGVPLLIAITVNKYL